MAILEVSNLKKIYTTRFGGNQVQALKNINFSVEEGEYVAIMGESGSGKTTLLNILAALDKPTVGEVLLNGKNLVSLKEKEISAFRREHLGFVFQDFNLLDNFSLKDNIFLPLVLSGVDYRAEFYAAHGIALAGNDHLGHGDTAKAGEHGHYGEPDGRLHLLNDLHTMNGLLHERFPDTPIILYGHSMGSFYARWYAEKWPESITALVISGTALSLDTPGPTNSITLFFT